MSNRVYTWTGNEETHSYDDIIELPHHVSKTRPRMSMLGRAAQFSPFDALTGFDESISEEARVTDRKRNISDQDKAILNEKLAVLTERCASTQRSRHTGEPRTSFPGVTVTYFVADTALHRNSKKEGGAYITYTGTLKRIDPVAKKLIFCGHSPGDREMTVPIQDIILLMDSEEEKNK